MDLTAIQLPSMAVPTPSFSVAHQKVELDVNFNQLVAGKTEITIYPDSQNLKEIRLHGRICAIKKVLVNNIPPPSVRHEDPCDQLTLHSNSTAHQHHLLAEKLARSIGPDPEPDIIITLPKKLKIQPVEVAEVHTQASGSIKIPDPSTTGPSATEATQALSDTTVAKFTPLTVTIEFETCHARETLQFVAGKRGSGRWPHVYTRSRLGCGGASSLFPCVDSINSRCTWDISIRCPRTVGDALNQALSLDLSKLNIDPSSQEARQSYESKEMVVICSGELTDEIVDRVDNTQKTVSFSCSQQLAPQQVGFAIGPFERVNLGELRDPQEVEELGRNAVEMLAFCLPGRAEETKNTCLPLTKAMDFVVHKYISCPFRSYSMCFVEDIPSDISVFAGVSMCSTRLLYPEDVIDPAQEVTRQLVHAIVSQWIGINIIAEEPRDNWVIIGGAYFITNLFMRDLCGNNEYRYHMKQQADRVYELDHERPSIYEMGALMHVDPAEYEFIAIKAPVVLFILDRRIAKNQGTSKMPAILAKILTRARTGDLLNNALSTDLFQKTVERFGHAKFDDFLSQWVKGAGCPRFSAFQRFNKKKLVVEMLIKQTQGTTTTDRELDINSFMRDAREDFQTVYAAPPQPMFTGPMTIRIHEADGTPYEHIVEIKDVQTNFEIPYNTKYKRLKRSKKQRARANTKAVAEGDEEGEALVYCLGDVLQGEDDVAAWKITEWSAEDEERMNSESYEWIRLDADFEWICQINLQMPGYMFSSQLQQDRDVVAQLEALRHISSYPPSPLVSSIFIRTLMDRRYFHGVRSLAAQGLVKHAKDEGEAKNIGLFHLKKAFEELYCVTEQGSAMTRPNDFSDQLAYMLRCEIIGAISKVRDSRGHTPREVKGFLLDKLKFNDNSANDYSDAHYVARLMKALTAAVIARPYHQVGADDMDLDLEDEIHELRQVENQFLEEIDRYRRMDEWTSSYQNLYSRTALECQSMLAAAGIARFSPLHFLQYTRPGNYDMLRQSAYSVLINPSILNEPSILRYVLYCMVADSSPWLRQSLQRAFGTVLAKRAVGEKTVPVQPVADGLVIEETAGADDRQADLARRQTMEGAMAALKKELGSHELLKQALWNAVCYDQITLEDLQTLLEFCRLIYEPKDEMKVTLRLPRYWRVENLGKGKLKFAQTQKVRSKVVSKWQPPLPPIRTEMQPSRPSIGSAGGLKLTFKMGSQSSRPTPTPPPPAPAAPVQTPTAGPGRVVLKFKPASKG
ncbi:Transcription initiation factor TFIID subunit 2 [Exophiala xenobiotica]|nr:Transcription initiation factor TFIID subunit 2 [Exophiala xenobiotica]KAK5238098.1 Transcription initiation factor TFIID subunit 2 [Exophiala xenobiotica]KAK5252053.1 Transcription initiation factor TFIID subunit 2 [Exophiala xenobiotica]KAK5261559.1 Transcription initiation factor TFIID subunit 2 [Exophiala xenobiotica]KAK5274018.1 Transcription initiation factor TFIID subunit 2 [Exophiala xenobiotica]